MGRGGVKKVWGAPGIGAATARVARVRTLPTFEKVKLDPPNFLGWTRPGPAQYSIPNYLILL